MLGLLCALVIHQDVYPKAVVLQQLKILLPHVSEQKLEPARAGMKGVFDNQHFLYGYGRYTVVIDWRSGALAGLYLAERGGLPSGYNAYFFPLPEPQLDLEITTSRLAVIARCLSMSGRTFVPTPWHRGNTFFFDERVSGYGTDWGPMTFVEFNLDGRIEFLLLQPHFNAKIPKRAPKLEPSALRQAIEKAYLERKPYGLAKVRDFGYRWLGAATKNQGMHFVRSWEHPNLSAMHPKGEALLGYAMQIGRQSFLVDAANGGLLRHEEVAMADETLSLDGIIWRPWNTTEGGFLLPALGALPGKTTRMLLRFGQYALGMDFDQKQGLLFKFESQGREPFRPNQALLRALRESVRRDSVR